LNCLPVSVVLRTVDVHFQLGCMAWDDVPVAESAYIICSGFSLHTTVRAAGGT